jgi:hypothetical protein
MQRTTVNEAGMGPSAQSARLPRTLMRWCPFAQAALESVHTSLGRRVTKVWLNLPPLFLEQKLLKEMGKATFFKRLVQEVTIKNAFLNASIHSAGLRYSCFL